VFWPVVGLDFTPGQFLGPGHNISANPLLSSFGSLDSSVDSPAQLALVCNATPAIESSNAAWFWRDIETRGEEVHLEAHHVLMVISIPSNCAMSQEVGLIKGKG
jgi:hypothetical protein